MSISRLEAVVFLSTLELFVVPQSDRAVRLGSPLVLCRSVVWLASNGNSTPLMMGQRLLSQNRNPSNYKLSSRLVHIIYLGMLLM